MRPPIPVVERWLIFVLGLHLCFLPWALGTMHVWSQAVSAGLAVAGFGIALAAAWRNAAARQPAPVPAPFRTVRAGLAAGALLLVYILIQALNPAWEYQRSDTAWWLSPLPHARWLPSGASTPFAKGDAWRALVVFGAAWMTAASLWIGISRRRSMVVLLAALAVNAFALSIVGFAEKALHADKVLWVWKPPASYFVSSFVYRNHAGAYFNLLLGLCAGLAFWFYLRGRQTHEKSTPSGVFAFVATAVALMVFLSESRAAAFAMGGILVVGAVLAWRQVRSGGARMSRWFVALGLGGFAAFVTLGLRTLNTTSALQRFQDISNEYPSAVSNTRALSARAALDLVRDQPAFGRGAGSFQYFFPLHQRNYPDIYREGRLYWEHAHNDYLELFSEFGWVGGSLLVAAVGSLGVALVQFRGWRSPLAMLVAAGLATTLVHAAVDFPFFNPAVLITWVALAMGALKMLAFRITGSGAAGDLANPRR